MSVVVVSRFRWWIIPTSFLLLDVLSVAGVFICVNYQIQHKIKIVSTRSQAEIAANSTASTSSSTSSVSSSSTDENAGLDALDAGDFSKVETKNYPIIKVKQKDPNIENILLIGIDGGDPGGVGVNRADAIVVDFQEFSNIIGITGNVPITLTAIEASTINVGSTARVYSLNGPQALAYA